MKKKINITFCIINIIVILITLSISMYVVYNIFKKHVINDLKYYENKISQSGALDNIETLDEKIVFANIRVTLIDATGKVLYESDADFDTMENHSNRPEIKEAKENGYGISLRNSETIGIVTYYYAVELDNGNILRVSREASSIIPLFTNAIYILLFVFILLIIICLFVSSLLTKRIVKPIKEMASNFDNDNIEEMKLYDELIPFVKKIKEQHSNIKYNVEELKKETAKIQMITNNMAEGILFLDKDKHILSINNSACILLSLRSKTFVGESIYMAIRNSEILDSIEMAGNGESNFIELSIDGKRLQIFSNPIVEKVVEGIMCFILDITEKYNRDKMRREFTANVSHELKTPLTSIYGYSELIKLKIAKDEDVTNFASKIYNESMRLLTLINDIIKLSELDEGIIADDFTQIKLTDLVHECVISLEEHAKHNNITINIESDNSIIQGNRSMIFELIFNLIDNAIRYNQENGQIDIEVKETQNNILFSVKDSGIGIPTKYKDRIFERFFRVDKSRSKSTGGTGLGLSIVKHIANAHHALIECTSEENVGTKITIIFKK